MNPTIPRSMHPARDGQNNPTEDPAHSPKSPDRASVAYSAAKTPSTSGSNGPTHITRLSIQRIAPYIIAASALATSACEQGKIDTNESYCLRNICDGGPDGSTGGTGGMLNVDGSAANGGSGGTGNIDGSAVNGGSGGTGNLDGSAATGGTAGSQNADSGLPDSTPDSPIDAKTDSAQTPCGTYETPCGTFCCKTTQFCTPAKYCNDCPPHTSNCRTGICINLDYSDNHCGGCGNTCSSWETCWQGECN